jgi:hypothetical protein
VLRFIYEVKGTSEGGKKMNELTKGGVRTDMKYVREVMRQMEDALKKNDFYEVAVLANEIGACMFSVIDKSGFDI